MLEGIIRVKFVDLQSDLLITQNKGQDLKSATWEHPVCSSPRCWWLQALGQSYILPHVPTPSKVSFWVSWVLLLMTSSFSFSFFMEHNQKCLRAAGIFQFRVQLALRIAWGEPVVPGIKFSTSLPPCKACFARVYPIGFSLFLALMASFFWKMPC